MLWRTRTLTLLTSVLAVAVDPAIGAPLPPAAPRVSTEPTVALLPFTDRTDGRWWLWTGCSAGEGVAHLLADSLAQAHDWALADTARLSAMARARAWRTDALDDAQACELARALDADWVVLGAVTAFGIEQPAPDTKRRRWGLPPKRRNEIARVTLELRVLDAASGAVRRSQVISRERLLDGASSARDAQRVPGALALAGTPLGDAVREVVSAAVQLLTQERHAHWSARVVRLMRYGLVELDVGRSAGLTRGDRLSVWRTSPLEGDAITGELTGGIDEVAAEVVVTGFTVDGRRAVAKVVRGRVVPGDLARPTAAWTPRVPVPATQER